MKLRQIIIGRISFFFIILLLLISQTSCNRNANISDGKLTIGVLYQNLQNEFIINIQDAITAYAEELNINLIQMDGRGKAENQIYQLENMMAIGIDAIILNPFDKYGSAPIVSIARRENIPIVVLNSVVINLDKANAYVGSNDFKAGQIAANYGVELIGYKGNVAIIHGPNGHSAEIQRSEGMYDILKKYDEINIIFEQSASWDRAKGLALMENWLASNKPIDLVLAQNDEMALGAFKAIEATGKIDKIHVIGIDAIPDALESVKKGEIAGTVFQDSKGQGRKALDVAITLANGDTVSKINYIPFKLISKSNIDSLEILAN